ARLAVTRAARAAADAPLDAFLDSLWLEDGLAANTLAAYRRDLTGFSQWLQANGGGDDLLAADASRVQGWFAASHAGTRPSTANRRLAALRRFYQWAMREGRIRENPCLRTASAKPLPRLPNTLSQDQVEALLDAPDTRDPLGVRDRAM